MAAQSGTVAGPEQDQSGESKIQQLRALFADAPETGRKALDNVLGTLTSDAAAPPPPMESAGRSGSRVGRVSELTIIVPLAPGGAQRLRTFLRLLHGNLARGVDPIGTVHDMRFVLLDNDTKLLFATTYDGEWDAYIDDFVTKIPNSMDILFCNCKGWPGIRSPEAKDYLAKYQVTAEGWYVANDLTVAETRRLRRIGQAVDQFLDTVGDE